MFTSLANINVNKYDPKYKKMQSTKTVPSTTKKLQRLTKSEVSSPLIRNAMEHV